MIEPIMFVGIGFLVAGLLVIGVIPLVHARAVRLTQRRLEALTPLSMAEIQADKDQLRAEFAMSTRRLEMSVEQMKAKTSSQLAEIGKKSEAIGRLKLELGEKTAALFAAEAKEKQLADELALYRTDTEIKSTALEEAERALAATQAELAQVTANFNEASVTADSQRVELVMLRAQAEALKGQIESYEKETKELHGRAHPADRRDRQPGPAAIRGAQQGRDARQPRRRARPPAHRPDHGSRDPRPPRAGAGRPARRAGPLPRRSRIRRRTACATRRPPRRRPKPTSAASSARPSAATAWRPRRSGPRRRCWRSSSSSRRTSAPSCSARSLAMKREAETAWASERMENAVLRERINDVAAEVARLTATLEGPGSPIDTILAADAARPAALGNGANGGAPSIAPMAAAPRARSPTASGRCRAAPRACRRRAGPERANTKRNASEGVASLDTVGRCLKSWPWPGRLAQRESVPFTRERS